jgi:hypothetical protein
MLHTEERGDSKIPLIRLALDWAGAKLLNILDYQMVHVLTCGPGSVAGIATGYGLDSPGIESQWGPDFPHLSRLALGPTQPPVQWLPGLSRGLKSGWGVTLTPHPLLVPLGMKE